MSYHLFPLHLIFVYLLVGKVKWGEIVLSTKFETGKSSKLIYICKEKDEC